MPHQRKGQELKCPVCGTWFYLAPSEQRKRAKTPCCSRDCDRRTTSKIWDNEEKVIAIYNEGKSIWHIKSLFGGDHATIAKFLRARGVTVRPAGYYSEASRNSRYKGGSISEDGYRVIQVNKKSIFEHRKVMEDFLGRKLHPREHVHHLNGKKLDNRIENLSLLTPSAHGKISAKQYHDWRQMYHDRILLLEKKIKALRLGLTVGTPEPK